MRAIFILFTLICSLGAENKTQTQVNDFLQRLDGNYKERKQASKELNNLPVDFYPHLKQHLEQDEVSLEVKLRLTKEKMFPLRAKWLHKKRMEWYRKHTVEAYQEFGHRDPKWDKEVNNALELVLTQFNEYWYIQGYANVIGEACQLAVKKGCKDPLILYFLARGSRIKMNNVKNLQLKKMHLNAATALQKSKYHDYFKFRATRLAAYYVRLKNNRNSSMDQKGKNAGLLKMIIALPYFQRAIVDKDLPFIELFYNAEQYCTVYKDCGKSIAEGLELIKPLLAKQYGLRSQAILATEGIVGITQAADEKRNSYEEGQKIELNALSLLEEAWNIDPAQKDIAARILKTLRYTERKEEFEKWYNNILLAEPGNLDAFASKRDFLFNNGSLDDMWAYGEAIIKQNDLMLKQIPSLIDKIAIKIAEQNDHLLFDFSALYKNKKAWSLMSRAYDKYITAYPEDKNNYFIYANYAASLSYWSEAHKLFNKAGAISQYKGRIDAGKLRERKLEAAIYHRNKINAAEPNHLNFEKRVQEAYEQKVAAGHYHFSKFYQKNNEQLEPEVKEVLTTLQDDWYGKPEVARDHVKNVHEVYERLAQIRKKGNKDPLIYMLWAQIKDSWYKGDKSEYFKAAQEMLQSKYPKHLKLQAINMGIGRLGIQKVITEEEKTIALKIIKRVPEFIDKEYLWPEQYYYLFSGMKVLKNLGPELVDPILNRYKELGKMTEFFMVQAHFNNRMAWYTHSLSKKKNWRLINKYNRQAKVSMKNAWMEDPHNSFAAEGLFRFTDRGQADYVDNFRRAMHANLYCYSILRKFMEESSNGHSRSRNWSPYPQLVTQLTLLHHKHALDHAKASKTDPDILNDHWSLVSSNFAKYLEAFPNDTVTRSKYALYAIKCNKDGIATDQLKVLGKYAIPWVFGSDKKLKEFQEKYLKE